MESRRAIERRVVALASRQHGVASKRQLYEVGLNRGRIDSWLETGRLFRIFHGVYAVGMPADSASALGCAGTICAGREAVLAGLSAAAARGLTTPGRFIDVARPVGASRIRTGAAPHQRWTLRVRASHLATSPDVIGPTRVMSTAGMFIDLAGMVDLSSLRRLFLNAGRSGLLTEDCLAAIRSKPRFPGRRRLIRLVDQWTPGTGKLHSPLEAEFILFCGEHGIPAPRTNVRLGGYEVDCLWPEARLVVELDSRTFHDDGFGFEDDRRKGNALTRLGYTVVRFTPMMLADRPGEIVAELRSHLGDR